MLLELHPFIVPLVEVKKKLQVNWSLIQKIQTYVEHKLLDVVFLSQQPKNLHTVDPCLRKWKVTAFANQSSLGIWDDKFTGVRYVKLEKFRASSKWDLPALHLERRNNADQKSANQTTVVVENFEDVSILSLSTALQHLKNQQFSTKQLMIKGSDTSQDIFTVQQYNYDKYGLFLNPRYNANLF